VPSLARLSDIEEAAARTGPARRCTSRRHRHGADRRPPLQREGSWRPRRARLTATWRHLHALRERRRPDSPTPACSSSASSRCCASTSAARCRYLFATSRNSAALLRMPRRASTWCASASCSTASTLPRRAAHGGGEAGSLLAVAGRLLQGGGGGEPRLLRLDLAERPPGAPRHRARRLRDGYFRACRAGPRWSCAASGGRGGRICMDQVMVNIEWARRGTATRSSSSASRAARASRRGAGEWAGTIPYEILTRSTPGCHGSTSRERARCRTGERSPVELVSPGSSDGRGSARLTGTSSAEGRRSSVSGPPGGSGCSCPGRARPTVGSDDEAVRRVSAQHDRVRAGGHCQVAQVVVEDLVSAAAANIDASGPESCDPVLVDQSAIGQLT